MKVCIFGTGALGGHAAVRLATARLPQPLELSVVARGPQLKGIRHNGLTLISGDEKINVRITATDDPSSLPPQDLVVVTMKSPSAPAAADALARLTARDGCALFISNGLPWWWRHGIPGAAQRSLERIDPDNVLWTRLGPQRVLGGVAYAANEVTEPGVVRHRVGNKWIFGELDGSLSPRLLRAVEIFNAAGLNTQASPDIRRDVWAKLLTNAANGAVAAITRLDSTAGGDEALRQLKMVLLTETLEVAAATGWDLRPETDVAAVASGGVKGNRPSMLQDVLAGRPIEVEAYLGQMQAFARELKVPTPALDVVLPLLRGVDLGIREPLA